MGAASRAARRAGSEALRRWEAATGKHALLDGTSETYADVKAARENEATP